MSDLFLVQHHAASDPSTANWSWRQISGLDQPAETQTGDVDTARAALAGQRLISVICGFHVNRLRVELPLKGAKLLAAAPFAVEDALAEDIDELHFANAPVSNGHNGVYAVRHQHMKEELETLAALDYAELVAMVPDYALLPSCQDDTATVAASEQFWWLQLPSGAQLKTLACGLPGLAEELRTLSSIRFISIQAAPPPEHCSMSQRDDLGHFLDLPVSLAQLRQCNLLSGAYAQKSGNFEILKDLRWPAALAASVVLAHTALSAGVLHQTKTQTEAAWQAAETAFKGTFPQITRIVDMRLQASQALANSRSGSDTSLVLDLMKAGADALQQTPDLKLENTQFRESALYLSLSGKNLQALESLRAKLEKNPSIRLEVQSAQGGSDGVEIRLKLEKA